MSISRKFLIYERFSRNSQPRLVASLGIAKYIVKCSSIVHKSIEYLDLSTCEYSEFRRKTEELQEFFQLESNFGENLLRNRKILYTLHLDTTQGADLYLKEVTLGKVYHTIGDIHFYMTRTDDQILFLRVVAPSWVYRQFLNNFMMTAIEFYFPKSELIRKFVKFIKLYDLPNGFGSSVWLYFFCILCRWCNNSVIVKEFSIEIGFEALGQWVCGLQPEESDSFLDHAQRIMCSEWKLKFIDYNLINRCVVERDFQKVVHFLKHFNASSRFEELYEDLKRHVRGSMLHLAVVVRRGGTNPVDEGKISNERDFLLNQIMMAFMHDSSYSNDASISSDSSNYSSGSEGASKAGQEALCLLWRTIPAVYFSLDEIVHAYGSFLDLKFQEDVHDFYTKALDEDTSAVNPRSLQHLCRVMVRKALSDDLNLSGGIGKLSVPYKIQSFLRLEY